jgi:hypothetical protein
MSANILRTTFQVPPAVASTLCALTIGASTKLSRPEFAGPGVATHDQGDSREFTGSMHASRR